MKNNWTLVDIVGILTFVVMICIVCYQNHRISLQNDRITLQQTQIQQLTESLDKSIINQNKMVEIQQEQTAAIVVLGDKLNGRK